MLTQRAWSAAVRNLVGKIRSPQPRRTTATRSPVLELEARVLLSGTRAGVMAAPNVAPVVGGVSGSVSFTEDADPVILAGSATVTDADSSNFSGGKLTVSITANAQSTDRLLIASDGVAPGQIAVKGSKILYSGKTIGSVTGGVGTTPLTISFNSSSSPAAAQALLRNIAYWTGSQTPTTAPRTISVTLSDGDGGTSTPQTVTVSVTAVDDAPVISGLGAGAVYSEVQATPVVLSPSAKVSDVDSTNFAGGVLTVSISHNAEAGDKLSIRNQGTAAGQIGFSAGTVTYGGVAIGTVVGDQTTGLTITLNAAANPTSVTALLRNVTFAATGANPSSASRQVDFQLSDGDGGTSAIASTYPRVATINDPPTISTIGGNVNYVRGSDPVFLSQGATVTDADSANLSGGRLTVRITTNVRSADGIAIYSEGFDPGQLGVDGDGVYFGDVLFGRVSGGLGSTPLTVTFNSNATVAAVQALVRNLGFFCDDPNTTTAPRTVTFQLTDGDGGASPLVSKQVTLT